MLVEPVFPYLFTLFLFPQFDFKNTLYFVSERVETTDLLSPNRVKFSSNIFNSTNIAQKDRKLTECFSEYVIYRV